MINEILSLETAEKLARIDKAIKYIKDRMILEQAFCLDMKQCDELLKILEGNYE